MLSYYRLTLDLHEILGLDFGKREAEFYEKQLRQECRFNKLDVVGMALTALSASSSTSPWQAMETLLSRDCAFGSIQ